MRDHERSHEGRRSPQEKGKRQGGVWINIGSGCFKLAVFEVFVSALLEDAVDLGGGDKKVNVGAHPV